MSAHPELDQVESVLWAFAEQVLEAALLLRKLVIDLSDVHTLQQGVAVARVALADVHKQVLVVLKGQKMLNQTRKEAVKCKTVEFTLNSRALFSTTIFSLIIIWVLFKCLVMPLFAQPISYFRSACNVMENSDEQVLVLLVSCVFTVHQHRPLLEDTHLQPGLMM